MTQAGRQVLPKTLFILIADDDEGDRKQIRRALTNAGFSYQCVEATGVGDAINACDAQAFDCAFIDYQMPGHDGLEGIAALHERLPFMSIIMATGHGDEQVATEAMKHGASDYISKASISADSIGRAVNSALEKSGLRRQLAAQRDELETFAAVLAHDLSAPISSILLFARTIGEDLAGGAADHDETIALCRDVVSAAQRAAALIDTLYNYTRAESPAVFVTVDMQHVLDSAMINLRPRIEAHGSRVTHGELPLVNGNAPQLVQLLQNLIGNAIKYCSAVTPTIHVTATPGRDGMWLFAVSDNGIGIADEHRQKVFEPFKRLHGAGGYEGTGLGLAICKKLVERHGGVIRCESGGAGLGATFLFTLHGPADQAVNTPDPLSHADCVQAEF
ncbi:MAG: Phytochrome, two-component sensor histidine kinase [Rhizobium sp.]|nr:Phytochrome, two-component sensor histidine kinase [Rhizobium sp.]